MTKRVADPEAYLRRRYPFRFRRIDKDLEWYRRRSPQTAHVRSPLRVRRMQKDQLWLADKLAKHRL